MLWPLLQVLQLQKMSFGAFFGGLQSVHGQNTRLCILPVFATAQKFTKSCKLAPFVFITHLMHNIPYINMLCMN